MRTIDGSMRVVEHVLGVVKVGGRLWVTEEEVVQFFGGDVLYATGLVHDWH